MTAEWATLVVSVVIVLSTAIGNMIGSGINNRRVAELKVWISDRFGQVGERIARVEAKLETQSVDRRDVGLK